MKEGVKIVLTSSIAEISQYRGDAFLAFLCTFPYKLTINFLKKYLIAENKENFEAKFAPYGLRKVEAVLIKEFGEENVKVVHYENLHKFVGKNTKIVGITSMDPLGLAYVSTTYNSLIGFGGESLNSYEFKRLLNHPSLKQHNAKIVVGGAGVWQIKDANMQDIFGIDYLISGECEEEIANIFNKILNGEELPKYIQAKKSNHKNIPLIRNPATYGSVEITRGCGRGCHFCSPTNRTRYSFPIEHILKEVEVNIKGGQNMIFTTTEDMFLYDSYPKFIPNRESIVKVYKAIADYPGVEHIELSHASLAPILYDKKILEELTPILMEKTLRRHRVSKEKFITVEVGIETGSSRLMNKHMKGKALPFSVDNWSELVVQGIGHMNDYDWFPLCTIMTGMPDETEEDVIATLELVDELKNAKMFFTPVLFIPLEDALLSNARRASLEKISELQWEFISTSWRNNMKFWASDRELMIKSLGFFLFWGFMRWIHGKKSVRPVMKFFGFDTYIPRKVGKNCKKEICK